MKCSKCRRGVQEATRRIMAALTDLVAGIRGVHAPAERFDPRLGRRVPYGPAATDRG